MLVVSDNSPLNILIRIGQVELLPKLFGNVVVPLQVADEMKHAAAPSIVRGWIQAPPAWLAVIAPRLVLEVPRLDLGERAAISLALELHADVLLVDESDARQAAIQRGLKIVGAVGILETAADRGLIADLQAVHDLIRQSNFHVAAELLNESLSRHLAKRREEKC